MPDGNVQPIEATGASSRDGSDALPPADTSRWVARRKAQVVEAIQSGRLSLDEALRRYKLSVEEFGAWKRALYRFGVQGLRAARAGTGRAAKHRHRRAPAGAHSGGSSAHG
jgi:hypothetical protein